MFAPLFEEEAHKVLVGCLGFCHLVALSLPVDLLVLEDAAVPLEQTC